MSETIKYIIGALIMIIISAILFTLGEKIGKKCPYCKEAIDKKATKCPHCQSDLQREDK